MAKHTDHPIDQPPSQVTRLQAWPKEILSRRPPEPDPETDPEYQDAPTDDAVDDAERPQRHATSSGDKSKRAARKK